ncbi:hypothetical protein GIB67_019696 [Kingdonia uniflora]|uniref:Uncharacterized protein n=1 Tax=Kingdonia uniflora TaxID=39325 RepID=A0A7J7MK61_9MAGN|nr:hypothetical protein GIB67_019696 [Kingdonia uniflora]
MPNRKLRFSCFHPSVKDLFTAFSSSSSELLENLSLTSSVIQGILSWIFSSGKSNCWFLAWKLLGYREGVIAVEEPIDCPNISRVGCKFAFIFQQFLQHLGIPIWNRLNNTGFWHQLTVQDGKNSGQAFEVECLEANILEVMLMVQLEPVYPDFYKIGYVRSVRAYRADFKEGPDGFGVYASNDIKPL